MAKRIRTWKNTVVSRMRGETADEGAGFVEYAGLLVLIAAIVTAVVGLGLDGIISGAISDAVTAITGG
jgi:Flp pilus assembly pilin Flp